MITTLAPNELMNIWKLVDPKNTVWSELKGNKTIYQILEEFTDLV